MESVAGLRREPSRDGTIFHKIREVGMMLHSFWSRIFKTLLSRTARLLKRSLALAPELWLPLPLIGLIVWLGGGALTNHFLGQSSSPVVPLRETIQLDVQPAVNFLEIRAEIDKTRQQTTVNAIQIFEFSAEPRSLVFTIETAEFTEVEAEIAKRLDISLESVRRLVSYRIQE